MVTAFRYVFTDTANKPVMHGFLRTSVWEAIDNLGWFWTAFNMNFAKCSSQPVTLTIWKLTGDLP